MTSPLITVAELAGALDTPHPPVLLDIRWQLGGPPGAEEYAKGHLPGAHYLDLDQDLADPPGRAGRHPLPATERLTAALRRAGVTATRPVVAYDAGPSLSAARAWWLLRWAGHPDVRVLDGGLAAWLAAGHALSTEAPAPGDSDFTVEPGRLPTVDITQVAGAALLLDARAGERYRGETEPIDPRAGHIPGAVSAPTTENLAADGRFLPAAELASRFAALGVTEPAKTAVYCGSGVTAAHQLLALEVAGYEGAALYPGSWSEWSADPENPVAVG
ncbi:sulfurtransferase [Kitasatospora sp. NPDC004531]